MSGDTLAEQLRAFADHVPVPAHGRYVPVGARIDPAGRVSAPPPASDPVPKVVAGIGVGALAAMALTSAWRHSRSAGG